MSEQGYLVVDVQHTLSQTSYLKATCTRKVLAVCKIIILLKRCKILGTCMTYTCIKVDNLRKHTIEV